MLTLKRKNLKYIEDCDNSYDNVLADCVTTVVCHGRCSGDIYSPGDYAVVEWNSTLDSTIFVISLLNDGHYVSLAGRGGLQYRRPSLPLYRVQHNSFRSGLNILCSTPRS